MAKLLNANLEKRETSEINFQPECLYRSQWPSPRFGRCACQIPASFLSCWTSLVHSEEATAPSLSTLFYIFLDFPCMFQRPIGSSLNPAQWISMKFRLWQYQTPALGECNTANAWTKKQISEQQEYPNNREILGMSFVSCRPKSFSELFFSFGVTFHHSGCLVFGGPCCFSHSYCRSLRYRYGMLPHLLERYIIMSEKKSTQTFAERCGWAPTSYKWSCNAYKWITGVKSPYL